MTTETYQPKVSRRCMLRGLGATLTLPWLESQVWAQGGNAAVKAGPPRRWAALVFGNGVVTERWWAKGQGDAMEFSDTLAPLADWKQEVLFLENFRLVENPPYVLPHGTHYTNFLSGFPVRKQAVPTMAVTLDQYLARHVGRQTVVPTLNLGLRCMPPRGVALDTISWVNANTPVMPEAYPAKAFDQLFDVSSKLEDRSILDDVHEDAKRVRGKLNVEDQRKFDNYLESIREVERRIERATNDERLPGAWRPTLDKPDMPRPEEGQPQDIPEYMKLMMDIILLAFRMDKTRIATLQFNNDGNNGMRFGFLDGVSNNHQHGISHHGNRPEGKDEHVKTVAYHAKQFAYFIEQMKSIDEGGTTMLDNSMVLFGTNFIDGHTHDTSQLPLVLAGRGGGTIRPGRIIKAQRDEDRAACNIYLSMLNRMGVPDESFGDGHRPVELG